MCTRFLLHMHIQYSLLPLNYLFNNPSQIAQLGKMERISTLFCHLNIKGVLSGIAQIRKSRSGHLGRRLIQQHTVPSVSGNQVPSESIMKIHYISDYLYYNFHIIDKFQCVALCHENAWTSSCFLL